MLNFEISDLLLPPLNILQLCVKIQETLQRKVIGDLGKNQYEVNAISNHFETKIRELILHCIIATECSIYFTNESKTFSWFSNAGI